MDVLLIWQFKIFGEIFWFSLAVVNTSPMALPKGEFSKLTVEIVGELLDVLPKRSFGRANFSAKLFWSTIAVVKTSHMASSNGEFSKRSK